MFFYWLGASQNEEFVDENQARFFSKIEKFFEEVKKKQISQEDFSDHSNSRQLTL